MACRIGMTTNVAARVQQFKEAVVVPCSALLPSGAEMDSRLPRIQSMSTAKAVAGLTPRLGVAKASPVECSDAPRRVCELPPWILRTR